MQNESSENIIRELVSVWAKKIIKMRVVLYFHWAILA